jgi:hypothetical protein
MFVGVLCKTLTMVLKRTSTKPTTITNVIVFCVWTMMISSRLLAKKRVYPDVLVWVFISLIQISLLVTVRIVADEDLLDWSVFSSSTLIIATFIVGVIVWFWGWFKMSTKAKRD